jgi:hypothetical protein
MSTKLIEKVIKPQYYWPAYACGLVLFASFAFFRATCDGWRWDEGFTWRLSHESPLSIIRATAGDVHPPLHYLMLHAWLEIKDVPWMIRAYSLLMGALALILGTWLAGRMAGPRAALWTAVSWGTCAGLIHFCQDARMYPQGLLLELIAVVGWGLSRRHPWRGWLLMGLATLAAAYTHNFGIIFAAFLFTGAIADLWLHRSAQPVRRRTWLAVIAGCLIIVAGYAPWLPVLMRQRQNVNLFGFEANSWLQIGAAWFENYYTLGGTPRNYYWLWVPGLLLLGILPLFICRPAIRRWLAAQKENVINLPPWWALWLGLGPFIFLLVYSETVQPILEISRHGILFLPLVLITSGIVLAWIEIHFRRGIIFNWVLISFGSIVSSLNIVTFTDGPSPKLITALQQEVGPNEPVIFFPYEVDPLLRWGIAATVVKPGDRNFAVVMQAGGPNERSGRFERLQRLLERAGQTIPIYIDYDVLAYHVRNAGPETAREFLHMATPESPPAKWGGLKLERTWAGIEAARLFWETPWHPFTTIPQFHYREGARFSKSRNTLNIPILQAAPQQRAAVLLNLGVLSEIMPTTITYYVNRRHDFKVASELNQLVLAAWTRAGESHIEMDLHVPAPPLPMKIPRGDLPNGTYLFWLARAQVDLPTTAPLTIDIGSTEDVLYVREGFHEREGGGAAQTRWTAGSFSLEIPLLPERAYHGIILRGMLGDKIQKRATHLTIMPAEGPPLECEAASPQGWGETVFVFPQPLRGDLARFDFKLFEVWIPGKDKTKGIDDPRELGFLLDNIKLF